MKNADRKRLICFWSVVLIGVIITSIITVTYASTRERMEYGKIEYILINKSNKITSVISKLLYKTQMLAALVIQSDGDVQSFERVASNVLDDPAIKNVILAPGGVVKHVYPIEGNQAVLGLDYFSQSEGNREAIVAKETGELVLGGPFNLVQGGQALVGRLPVYLDKENNRTFWGLVSVTLNYPQALVGADLELLKEQGYTFELWRMSPDTNDTQIIATSNDRNIKNERFVEHEIDLFGAKWFFKLAPVSMWYEFPENWVFIISGILLSLLAAQLITHNRDLIQVKCQLEQITVMDPLTGILNRRGLFQALAELTSYPNEQFVLCYIDLDNFKNINDTYGHAAGDRVLIEFAYAVQRRVGSEHILGRIGGDEFILAMRNSSDKEKVAITLQDIGKTIADAMSSDYPDIPVGKFSLGQVVFPQDGETADILIAAADKIMYNSKFKRTRSSPRT